MILIKRNELKGSNHYWYGCKQGEEVIIINCTRLFHVGSTRKSNERDERR